MRSMMMHFALSAALVTGGFGKPVAYRYATDAATQAKAKTVVEVQNTAFNDAVIYAVQGLRVVRLGTVSGLTTQKLSIPKDLVFGLSTLRFTVHAIGTRGSQSSDEITISQGDTVSLFIPPF
jgi:hypothetical protein